MNARNFLKAALSLAFALAIAPSARGEVILFKFDWSPSAPYLTAGGGKVLFTNDIEKVAIGDSGGGTNLRVFSTASAGAPDVFGPSEGFYTLTVKVTDVDSGLSDTRSFDGQLQGSFDSQHVNLTNTFLAPTTQSLELGTHKYAVTFGDNSFSPPPPPDRPWAGGIGALITASSIHETPEPSSLALLAIGAVTTAGALWRRRRSLTSSDNLNLGRPV